MAPTESLSPTTPPSPWVQGFAPLIQTGGQVLDIACGSGRHARWLTEQGFKVTGVDIDSTAVAHLSSVIHRAVVADLEADPWPFELASFDAVVMTNYLWRPLWSSILASLKPGGVLIVETFGVRQANIGRPKNPDFLLTSHELFDVLRASMQVVAFEDGPLQEPFRWVQRVAATLPPSRPEVANFGLAHWDLNARYRLD